MLKKMKEEKFEVFNFKWEGKHETSHSTHKPQIGGKVALKVQLVKRMHLQLPHTVLHGGKLSVQSLTLPYKTNKLCFSLNTQTTHLSLPLIILSPNPKKILEINKIQSGRFPLSQ
jgi:Ser-tRNA(Ala) deacylase AlaX